MGILIVILVIAACVGGVFWNHYNAARAAEGVSFVVGQPPSVVEAAVQRTFNAGAVAALRGSVSGISVTSIGPGAFGFSSSIGDSGEISVSGDPAGSIVTARCLNFYIGSHPKSHNLRFAGLVDGIYTMLGLAPNAAKLKRWLGRLESRVNRSIAKSMK